MTTFAVSHRRHGVCRRFIPQLERLDDRIAPAGSVLVAPDAGFGPNVRVLAPNTGEAVVNFLAYDPSYTGGVRVAGGDVNGDGVADIVTTVGPGGGPHIKVFDGVSKQEIRSFLAYDPSFIGGLYLALGDVNADGFADIITGTGPGGGPHIQVFSGQTGALLHSFMAYDPSMALGVRVASGDIDGDGFADIITGAGALAGPHVQAFSGRDGSLLTSFMAYDPAVLSGLFVAAGDTDGDGRAEIITGADAGSGPHVQVFDTATGQARLSFLAYPEAMTAGVRVGAGDINGDGKADIITGPGQGSSAHIKAFSGLTGAELNGLLAFSPTMIGGVFVSGYSKEGNGPSGPPDDLNGPGVIDLGMLEAAPQMVNGLVSDAKPVDLYRFEVPSQLPVTVRLDDLTGDADLVLGRDFDGDGRLDVSNYLDQSVNPGTQSEQITTVLDPGIYYLKVYRFSGSAEYTLTLSGQQALAPIGAAGDPRGAIILGNTPGPTLFASGVVSDDLVSTLYRFDALTAVTVSISLTGLSADADLLLLADRDNSGRLQVLAQSDNPLSFSEEISGGLGAGTYYLLVYQYRGSTSYTLSVAGAAGGGGGQAGFNAVWGFGLVQAGKAVADAMGSPLAPIFLASHEGMNVEDLNMIGAGTAWAGGITGAGIIVAVIDTGLNFSHPDLAPNIWYNPREQLNGLDDDGNGFIDDVNGWDFVNNDNDPTDDEGHGSHVAGIIAAARNGYGTTGVAPNARIMPLKVLDSEGVGKIADIIRAIYYAVDAGAHVINLSLGGGRANPAVQQALEYAASRGTVVVAAAGNEGSIRPSYPAAYASISPGVIIAVGAVNREREVASFSNGARGNPAIRNFVVAPGVRIVSAAGSGAGFQTLSGTSMSAPHVAGVAALVSQANPGLTASQIIDILNRTADPNGLSL